MKLLRFYNKILLVMAVILFHSCKSEYDRLVSNELSSGVQEDSLIFGMYIGETKKDFYAKCWELNNKKLISQGTGNRTARYTEPVDSLDDPTRRKDMLFYGIFDDKDVMQGMDMTYTYTTWAPWNTERHSPSLVEDLKGQILKDYGGNDFLEIDLEKIESKAYVKVDGNRQILIYPKNNKDVVVKIENLPYKLKKK